MRASIVVEPAKGVSIKPGVERSETPANEVGQFECGTRILRVIHGRDARATFAS